MKREEVKKTLEKQFELLSKRSDAEPENLAALTEQMIALSECMCRLGFVETRLEWLASQTRPAEPLQS